MITRKSMPSILRDSVAYVGISLVAYGLVFGLMYIFVDVVRLGSGFAFFLTYLIAYIYDYITNLKIVFRKENNHQRLLGYLVYLVIFFGLGNGVFHAVGYFVGTHYLRETVITMLILFPLRFLSLRYLVFR